MQEKQGPTKYFTNEDELRIIDDIKRKNEENRLKASLEKDDVITSYGLSEGDYEKTVGLFNSDGANPMNEEVPVESGITPGNKKAAEDWLSQGTPEERIARKQQASFFAGASELLRSITEKKGRVLIGVCVAFMAITLVAAKYSAEVSTEAPEKQPISPESGDESSDANRADELYSSSQSQEEIDAKIQEMVNATQNNPNIMVKVEPKDEIIPNDDQANRPLGAEVNDTTGYDPTKSGP